VALLIALIQTPHRFRTKRQLWPIVVALQTRTAASTGSLGRTAAFQEIAALRVSNVNHNHDLKNVFKSAATHVSTSTDPLGDFLPDLLLKDEATMARLTLARKMGRSFYRFGKRSTLRSGELKQQAA